MSKSSELNDLLRVLRERYQNELPAKLAKIESLLGVLRAGQNPAQDDVHKLHRLLHSLTGSGATFGMSALSDTARQLEITFKELLESNEFNLPAEILDRITAQWRELKSAAIRPDVAPDKMDVSSGAERTGFDAGAVDKGEGANLLLLERDAEQARSMQQQLANFGYRVKVLHDASLPAGALAGLSPVAIIRDAAFAEAGGGSENMLAAQAMNNIPQIFISSRGDIASRLAAVRAGADSYFTKPVDIAALVNRLDMLSDTLDAEAFKVMVVDDEAPLAAFYAMTLQSAGMETVVVNDPLKVLDELADFMPELFLVDMYMPGCSGLELARVIRQQEIYVSTPIVFLSAETDVEKHLEAMQSGADDFLTKPIKPAHLVSAVTSRVQRYRILRSFMVRDGLTGLLNHTKIKGELEAEVMRAQRQKSHLAFAMVDVDMFKNVNDTHGHLAGDRVLKGLSRLLQQRLRKTDVIGRYGGEEFAVILKDTDAASAVAIMEEVRKAFAQIVQHAESGDFSVTFSCGVAAYPDYSSAGELNNAADKALYEAKHAGRNRVAIAPPAAGARG
ncbi:MAG: diguanylate cyclase [Gallionellaceae bacterium]|jgi:diguanylate cyclase (GGDEF)-like protein